MGANMKKAFSLAMAIPLLMIGTANAQQKQNYAEVDYVALRYSEPGAKASPSAGRLIVGSNVMENLGVEVMGAIGLGSGSTDGVSVKLDSGFGAFLRPQLKLGDALQVFGRVGYFRASLSGKSGPVEVKTSGGDIAYGLGVSYGVSDGVAITADYMWYYDKSSVAIKGFAVGAKFGF
jgi:opacity protein-like surface antigen